MIVWEDKWLAVKQQDGYTYVNFVKGDGVAVIGYRKLKALNDSVSEILFRIERRPCHYDGQPARGSVTGVIDGIETAAMAASRELKEETGYWILPEKLHSLGWVYPSKFSDHKCHVFVADLTDELQGFIRNDGSQWEKDGKAEWHMLQSAVDCRDPLVSKGISYLLYNKLV